MAVKQSDLVTVAELADRLKVTTRTIHRWIRERVIPPPLRLQRCLRWRREVLDRFLAEKGLGGDMQLDG